MFRLLVLVSLIGLGKTAAAELPSNQVLEVIEFEFEASFEPRTVIWLARLAKGTVLCKAHSFSVPTFENPGRTPEKLRTSEVSLALFNEFAMAFEDRGFRAAAEVTPGPGLDGTSWVFRKTAGSRKLEYKFWTPEGRPEVKSSALAIRLGKQIAAAAGLSDMFSARRKTDQPE